MQSFVFEQYVPMCLELLLPGATYFGILTNEESYGRVRWLDEREKPAWEAIVEKWPEVEQMLVWEHYKSERTDELLRSTVEVNGMVFDADEKSQNRMNRAITVMTHNSNITSVKWRLHDNTEAMIDLPTMLAALEAAAANQTDLWFPEQIEA